MAEYPRRVTIYAGRRRVVFGLALELVLVLSEAVLVLVTALRIVPRYRLGDTVQTSLPSG